MRNFGIKQLDKWQAGFKILDCPGQLGRTLLQEQVAPDRGSISVVLRDSTTAIKRAQTSLQYFSLDAITFFLEWDPWNRNHYLLFFPSNALWLSPGR